MQWYWFAMLTNCKLFTFFNYLRLNAFLCLIALHWTKSIIIIIVVIENDFQGGRENCGTLYNFAVAVLKSYVGGACESSTYEEHVRRTMTKVRNDSSFNYNDASYWIISLDKLLKNVLREVRWGFLHGWRLLLAWMIMMEIWDMYIRRPLPCTSFHSFSYFLLKRSLF